MGESLLKKYTDTLAPKSEQTDGKSPYCLNFVLERGEQTALSYSQLLWINYLQKAGSPPGSSIAQASRIILHFSTHTVHIWGFNLKDVHTTILSHEAHELRVIGERHAEQESDGPEVVQVDIMEVKPTQESMGEVTLSPEDEGG
jgi:hypothetical protein